MLLIASGLFFSNKLRWLQFDFKGMINGFKRKGNEMVSPFETLMFTLGARIGVGSLAGVALAIYIGGPGTIFWMWIATILVAPNAYVESYLGVLFHEKKDNIYQGGPSYYIEKGLNKKNLGKLYAILIIITYIFGFLTIQSNTIAKSFETFANVEPLITGIILSIVTVFVIVKGTKSIIDVSSKIMPFIGILYIGISFYVIGKNINILPDVLLKIIKEAFNFKSAGTGILTSFIIGVQRGMFSNEAGIGTGAIASSTVDNNDARGQGMIQVFGIHFTTLILCTLTAIMIMMSDYSNINLTNINGIEITQYALNYHLGQFGEIVLIITIFIFAFSTIISGYYYGENSLRFLNKTKDKKQMFLLKILTGVLLIVGTITTSSILWDMVDILIAVMGIINIYAIIKLRNKVK